MGVNARTETARVQVEQYVSKSAVPSTHNAVRSLDDLNALLSGRGASVAITPISNEGIVGDTHSLGRGSNKIEFSGFRNARVTGVVSESVFTFGTFLRSEPPNTFLGKELTAGNLVWLPPGSEREAVYAKPIDFACVYLPADRLERLLEERGFTGGAARFRQVAQLNLPDSLARLLVASNLLDTALYSAPLALAARYQARDVSLGHTELVKRVENLLIDHPGDIYSINSVCDRLRVSRRTLQRAFTDIIGVTPHHYLRNWRLTRAHEDLVNGRAKSVTEAAMYWGFFDLGRFAGYYGQLFGEHPSHTLIKALGLALPVNRSSR
jgi:AraC-like DNA-binding protein